MLRYLSSRLLPVVSACLVSIATVSAAEANARLCRQLETELASTGRGGGAPAKVQRYDAAIARQREQMAIARDQARDIGCGYSLSGRTVRQCAGLNATLDRMMRNLDGLQRDRARLARNTGQRSRKTLLAALDANGCRDEMVAKAPQEPLQQPPTPLQEMLARPDPDRDGLDDTEMSGAPFGVEPAGETFRTMCVRSCDGYFYPMSNAATVGDFDRDQKNCETSCPGTDMQIFYGSPNGDDPSAMLSIRSGSPYAALPTAFQHQDVSLPRPAGCGCNAAKNFEVIAGTPPPPRQSVPADDAGSGAAIPMPTPRPDGTEGVDAAALPEPAAAEPEAQSGSIIKVEPPAAKPVPAEADPKVEAPAAQPPAPAEPDATRNVRIVGPEFLPDPAGALDLRSTAPTAAP